MSATEDTEREILNWVSLEHSSITQALRAMAEHNEEDAARIEKEVTPGTRVAAGALRDSAKSWRKKASDLDLLVETLPEDWEAWR